MLIVFFKNRLHICLLLLTKLMAVANKSHDNTNESSLKTENKQSCCKVMVGYSCVLILMRYVWLLEGKQKVAGHLKQTYSKKKKKKNKLLVTGIFPFFQDNKVLEPEFVVKVQFLFRFQVLPELNASLSSLMLMKSFLFELDS